MSIPGPTAAPTPGSARGATAEAESAAELVERFGLSLSTARPPLAAYVRQLWERRYFIQTFASSRTVARYSGTRLGQLWQVLTPLLQAAVYFCIFGLLLHTNRGVSNFIPFLVTGVFVMHFTQRSVTHGARAISGNLNLIRALHFPRATLPLSSTVVELRQMLVSTVILCVIVVLTGEPVTWAWLELVPVLALQTVFNAGLSFGIARLGARLPDVSQLLPFILRAWLYMSGVFFLISDRAEGLVADIMLINPTAVFIGLARNALISSQQFYQPLDGWLLAGAWAVVVFCVGFCFFWAGEETYGRG